MALHLSPRRTITAACLLLGGLACAPARAEDLPGSTACQAALRALNEAEEAWRAAPAGAASAAGPASGPDRGLAVVQRLFPFRQRVADDCLGGQARPVAPAARGGLPPVAARPGLGAPALPRLPQMPVPVVTVPMPRIEAPVTVKHCTGASCQASDGSALTRVGPDTWVGPRGLCTSVGGVVRCP